jgi:hypothetical protein
MYKNTRFVCVLAVLGAAALLGGCATSVPKAEYNEALDEHRRRGAGVRRRRVGRADRPRGNFRERGER